MAFQIYKSGQGRYVRIGTAIGAALVLLVLAWYTWLMLERHLPGLPKAGESAAEASFIGPYKVYLEYAIPGVEFAVMAVLVLLFLNKPSFADFLIATESEMKKVSWSSKAELLGSTAVVIVTVFLLAVFIFLVDYLLSGGLSEGWTVPYTEFHIPGLGLW